MTGQRKGIVLPVEGVITPWLTRIEAGLRHIERRVHVGEQATG